jgi:hypothetical protein
VSPKIEKSPRPDDQALLEDALRNLGCEVTRWRAGEATVRRADERFQLRRATVAERLGAPVASFAAPELTLRLADLLGLPATPEAMHDFAAARPLLRPRLVNARRLAQGPRRTMCRREAWGDLVVGVSVGSTSHRSFVSTRQLDDWSMEFEDVLDAAIDNLRVAIDSSHLHDVDGAPGLLAILNDTEPAASATLLLPEVLPGAEEYPGVLLSTPTEETLLVLPIEHDMGAPPLVGIVHATYAIAGSHDEPLSDQVFWRRGDDVIHIPTTWIEEPSSRRVHLEAEGVVEELLRLLGELD